MVAPFPGTLDPLGVETFVVGEQVFVLTPGYIPPSGPVPTGPMWKYAPATNTWSQLADHPGVSYQSPVFVIGAFAYFVSNTKVWRYDATNNTWTTMGTFPGPDLRAATAFSVNSEGYAVGGFYNTPRAWRYTPAGDHWTEMAAPPHLSTSGSQDVYGTAFVLGNNAYITGTNLDFWRYSTDTGTWTQLTYVNATYGCAFALQGRGYLISTAGLLEFDPANNQWSNAPNFPGTAMCNATCFAVGNRGYVGLGSEFVASANTCSANNLVAFWKLTPAP